jgi:hypothetical protein
VEASPALAAPVPSRALLVLVSHPMADAPQPGYAPTSAVAEPPLDRR